MADSFAGEVGAGHQVDFSPADGPSQAAAWKLFLLGFLTLFLELVLIRYLAGSVWNLGYFPNLVLIGVFVGMGCGFVFHHYVPAWLSPWLFQASVFCLLGLIGFVYFERPAVPGFSQVVGEIGGELFFTYTRAGAVGERYVLFAGWFVFVVAVFWLISQRTAKIFARFRPLTAYTLDIAGSCAGILCFMGLSWARLPAYAWFVVLIPLFLGTMPAMSWRIRGLSVLPLAAAIWVAYVQDTKLTWDPWTGGYLEVTWSPYQKVEYHKGRGPRANIFVNGVQHQAVEPADAIRSSFYQVPYDARAKERGRPPYKRVLIIGAGSGNDAVAALASGAEHVDAVEIDPVIAELGRRYHPAKPYADPRTRLIVDDGRAFLGRTPDGYDLIVFALTDSVVKVSAMSQLRLENYVFTVESVAKAFSLLSDDGDLVFYNSYRRPWLLEKIKQMVYRATGRHLRVLHQRGDFAVLAVGRRDGAAAPEPAAQAGVDAPIDDWPFLYLERRGIPAVYVRAMLSLAVLVAGLMFVLQVTTRGRDGSEGGADRLLVKLAFVLMGVAFLLLETKSIIRFSLLFGATWVNTSLVVLAVLLLVLAANWTAAVWRGPSLLPVVYALLILSCLLPWVFPLSDLLSLESRVLRFVVASLMTFSPIYFANLIFSLTFRNQPAPEHLFGWNLIGATLGGILEYTSMALGYELLAGIVAICYTIVFVLLILARRLGATHGLVPAVVSGGLVESGRPLGQEGML